MNRKPCLRQDSQGYDPQGRELFPEKITSENTMKVEVIFLNN